MRKVILFGLLLIPVLCFARPERIYDKEKLDRILAIESIKRQEKIQLTDAEIDDLQNIEEVKNYLKKLIRIIRAMQ